MEKSVDKSNLTRTVERRLAQLKVTARLIAHEIEVASGEKNVTLDRDLAESVLTTLELFIEDAEGSRKSPGGSPTVAREGDSKPQVTRLN